MGRFAELLILVLELVQLPVEAAVGEKLLVGSLLAELAFVHDQDGIGRLHCGESVCNEHAGAACNHAR